MKIIHLISIATYLSATFSFSVNLKIGKEQSEIIINAYLDLAYDKILISSKSLYCHPNNSCIITDKTIKKDRYQGTLYSYKEAVLTINVYDRVTNKDKSLDIKIRYCDMKNSIIGLNPNSTLADDLKAKPLLEINVYNKELNFTQDTIGSPLSVKKIGESEMYYMNSLITHKVKGGMFNPLFAKKSKTLAKICLHDKDVAEYQNYFFSCNFNSHIDWIIFVDNYNKYGLGYFNGNVSSIDKINTFSFDYDMQLFDSYDKEPMKTYKYRIYNFCDMFLGDFGAHRSSLRLLLAHNYGNDKLDVSILTKNQRYIGHNPNYFNVFVFVVFFSAVIFMIYWAYENYKRKVQSGNRERALYYRSINE